MYVRTKSNLLHLVLVLCFICMRILHAYPTDASVVWQQGLAKLSTTGSLA